jgi:hypothetical protein
MKTILCYGDSNTHGTLPIDFDMLETPFISSSYRLPRENVLFGRIIYRWC